MQNSFNRQMTKNKLKLYVESHLKSLLKINYNNIDVIEGQNSGDSYMKELEKELEKRIKILPDHMFKVSSDYDSKDHSNQYNSTHLNKRDIFLFQEGNNL